MSGWLFWRFVARLTLATSLLALATTWQFGRKTRFSPFFSPDSAALTLDETRVTVASDAFFRQFDNDALARTYGKFDEH
jgi:hypothetical protein